MDKVKNEATKAKKLAVEFFFQDAFCVDGEAKMVSPKGFKIESVIKLTDSKRGTFYVAKVIKN